MLSIWAIKSSEQAKDYFSPGGYYQKQDELASQTAWFGEGAASLGLTGNVDMSQFKELLDGNVAGCQLGRMRDGKREHQPGWDLTFSAPKSLSVLALIGGDERLIEAHKTAVKAAMGVLEKEFTKTRLRVSKDQVIEVPTGNLVAAQFLHSLSRDNDPQLHTHCVVANATLRSDGQWRSLQSLNFYDHKMLVGQIYRNELALQVKQLGYQLNVDYRKGFFEIKGVPQKILASFSKRRQAIESIAESPDAREMERATLVTRQNKRQQDKSELLAAWSAVCKTIGFLPSQTKRLINHSIKSVPEVNSWPVGGEQSVQQAIEQLTSKEAVFTQRQLADTALKLGLGEIAYSAVNQAVAEQLEQKVIIPSSLAVKGRVAVSYTTPSAFAQEQYLLKLLQQGRGSQSKLMPQWKVEQQLKESTLSSGQRAAIKLMMTSKDQFVGVQGYAGVGKTTMLRCAKPLIEAIGYKIRAYAPTHTAVEALKAETGIESRTLASFLHSMEKKQAGARVKDCSKEVWVVDEASLIGVKDMANLLTCARAAKSRVVLLGDKSQLGAVSWGKPFHLMMKQGMRCAVMKEIHRQKVEELKSAVEASITANSYSVDWPEVRQNPLIIFKQQLAASRGDIQQSLLAIKSDVVEEINTAKRCQALVDYYRSLTPEERINTLVIIPDNQTRHEMMPLLREVALQGYSEKNDQIKTTIFCEIDCPSPSQAQCYGAGDIVEFAKSYKKMDIQSGDRFYVAAVEGKTNVVTLSPFKEQGRAKSLLFWDPKKVAGNAKQAVTLFKEYERSLLTGEKIVFNKSDRNLGVKNGDIATITSMNGQTKKVTVKLANGKQASFDYEKFRQFDHGYANTAYKSQGKTVDRVVILAESYRENLITQKSFYVSLSRARYQAKIFTDSTEKLIKGLGERPGHKSSAIEQEQMKVAVNNILDKNLKVSQTPSFKGINFSL